MSERSIVLTGFMATGKSVVARRVADRLGRDFVDMDEAIAARAGKPIPAIFAAHGESHFRALEAELCASLGARLGLVVATGGGSLVDPRNRAQFDSAVLVCLDATPEAIVARVSDPNDRPMLAAGEVSLRERVRDLLTAREAAYRAIQHHVDTTGKTIEEVAEEVTELFTTVVRTRPVVAEPLRLDVNAPDGTYQIRVGPGLLSRVGPILADLGGFSTRCVVVTNPTVGAIYARRVLASLGGAGFAPALVEVADGERYKTLATLGAVFDRLTEIGLDRRSPVIALGGGVVGDLAGFAAASFLRGVPFVQLPTTLLAMIDSSLGGKVAVDHPGGKNLIGAFKQPRVVLADTDALATLPAAEWRSGLAEVVKHAVIADPRLFARLQTTGARPESAHEWLGDAIAVKRDVVERDPFELGERATLNLGHTFGHALEKLADFRLRHGDAVAVGLICAANLARRLGVGEPGLVDRLSRLLDALDLPCRVPAEYATADIIAAMCTDKKRVDGRLRFVVPSALGDVVVVGDVAEADVAAAIEASR